MSDMKQKVGQVVFGAEVVVDSGLKKGEAPRDYWARVFAASDSGSTVQGGHGANAQRELSEEEFEYLDRYGYLPEGRRAS